MRWIKASLVVTLSLVGMSLLMPMASIAAQTVPPVDTNAIEAGECEFIADEAAGRVEVCFYGTSDGELILHLNNNYIVEQVHMEGAFKYNNTIIIVELSAVEPIDQQSTITLTQTSDEKPLFDYAIADLRINDISQVTNLNLDSKYILGEAAWPIIVGETESCQVYDVDSQWQYKFCQQNATLWGTFSITLAPWMYRGDKKLEIVSIGKTPFSSKPHFDYAIFQESDEIWTRDEPQILEVVGTWNTGVTELQVPLQNAIPISYFYTSNGGPKDLPICVDLFEALQFCVGDDAREGEFRYQGDGISRTITDYVENSTLGTLQINFPEGTTCLSPPCENIFGQQWVGSAIEWKLQDWNDGDLLELASGMIDLDNWPPPVSVIHLPIVHK